MSASAQVTTERASSARTLVGAVRPRIRVLTTPLRTRWRPSFVSLCVTLMVACLTALLGINIVLTRGAYAEQQLSVKQTALMEQEQALAERVARESAPEVLAQRARDLGMIPNSSPAFIRMSDGAILGVPTPAQVDTSPVFSDLSAAQLTPEQAAAAAAAANGGAAAVGADGEVVAGTDSTGSDSSTDSTGAAGADADPAGDGSSSTSEPVTSGTQSASRESASGESASGAESATGDGAVPVGGQAARAASASGTQPDVAAGMGGHAAVGDGAQLVGAGQ